MSVGKSVQRVAVHCGDKPIATFRLGRYTLYRTLERNKTTIILERQRNLVISGTIFSALLKAAIGLHCYTTRQVASLHQIGWVSSGPSQP